MSDKLLFTCRVCGAETATHPIVQNALGEDVGVQGVCPAHCEDHDYEYDSYARLHYCQHCGEEPPDDWYWCDDDVGCFGGGYTPSEPIGIPASAMNGNAAERHKDPDAWDRWVRFSEACGYP